MKKRNDSTRPWSFISGTAIFLLIILLFISNSLVADSSIDKSIYGAFSGLVSIAALVVIVLCIVATFKAASWGKVIPLLGAGIAILVFVWTFFVSSFSRGGFTF